MSLRNGASGPRHGDRRKSAPVSLGIQYRSGMPLPLNQKTNRLSMAFCETPSAAYAVPVELNMLTSGGSPTWIAPPARVRPWRKRLRETLARLTITCDTALYSSCGEFSRHHH